VDNQSTEICMSGSCVSLAMLQVLVSIVSEEIYHITEGPGSDLNEQVTKKALAPHSLLLYHTNVLPLTSASRLTHSILTNHLC